MLVTLQSSIIPIRGRFYDLRRYSWMVDMIHGIKTPRVVKWHRWNYRRRAFLTASDPIASNSMIFDELSPQLRQSTFVYVLQLSYTQLVVPGQRHWGQTRRIVDRVKLPYLRGPIADTYLWANLHQEPWITSQSSVSYTIQILDTQWFSLWSDLCQWGPDIWSTSRMVHPAVSTIWSISLQ